MTNEIIIREVIEDYNNYINRVPEGVLDVANQLRDSNLTEGLNGINQLVEGINWLISAKNYLQTQNVEASFDETKIVDYLSEINDALEVQDYFLVADLLEYEISAYFSELSQVEQSN